MPWTLVTVVVRTVVAMTVVQGPSADSATGLGSIPQLILHFACYDTVNRILAYHGRTWRKEVVRR